MDLCGKPLLNYAINAVDWSGVDNYLYCSDPDVMRYVESKKVKFLERAAALDGDTILGEDIYRAFAEQVEADVYLLYHVTSPLLKAKYYRRGLDAVLSGEFDSALSALRIQTFMFSDGKPLNFEYGALPRTQDLPVMHMVTSGFFVYTIDALVQGGSRLGSNTKMVEVDASGAVDIDHMEDFKLAERLLKGACCG
jgi:CMP-N-acetylneuraminic acid synthetase